MHRCIRNAVHAGKTLPTPAIERYQAPDGEEVFQTSAEHLDPCCVATRDSSDRVLPSPVRILQTSPPVITVSSTSQKPTFKVVPIFNATKMASYTANTLASGSALSGVLRPSCSLPLTKGGTASCVRCSFLLICSFTG